MAQVPVYQRQVGTAQPDATPLVPVRTDGLSRGLDQAGNDAAKIATLAFEREATAQAKERDAEVSDKIRALMYDPATGFMSLQGKNAVDARPKFMEELASLRKSSGDGLSPAAARKIDAAIQNRIGAAEASANRHTTTSRETWMDGAASARISAASNDALFNTGDISQELGIIRSEIAETGARKGWDAGLIAQKQTEATSEVVFNTAMSLADGDPRMAQDFLKTNKASMNAVDYIKATQTLKPIVKEWDGRAVGRKEYVGLGNMEGLLTIAADTLGMNERDQNEALRAWMADGGQNLDPATTAWCAGFANALLAKAGIAGTDSLAARSFLDWGMAVDTPERGDVVVLARGNDPSKGHVGFFEGYDESGNILLMGGNQGDSVSIRAHSARNVLGYRRQVTSPNAGDVAAAVQRIARIKDPDERAYAMDEFNTQNTAAEGVRSANVQAVVSQYSSLIEGGGSTNEIPLGVRQQLGAKAMSALRTYEKSVKSGVPIQTNKSVYLYLKELAIEDPQAFAKENMMDYKDVLSDTDWKSITDQVHSGGISQGEQMSGSQLLSEGRLSLQDTIGPEKDNLAQYQDFKGELLRYQADFYAENKRWPNEVERLDKIVAMTAATVLNPSGFNNEQSVPAFAIDWEGITAEDLAYDLEVVDESISPQQVGEFALQLHSEMLRSDPNADSPTPEQVLEYITEIYAGNR